MSVLIIYHGNCPDGFCAAWVAATWCKEQGKAYELYPAKYGEPPPYLLAQDRDDVYIVDFSYPRGDLEALRLHCERLTVLDHHKTAQEALAGLDYCTFDMERSGAMITWDHFYPNLPAPMLVHYVQDRDLWRHKLPDSDVISLRIRLAEHTIEAWDDLALRGLEQLLQEGAGAQLYLEHYVRDVVRGAYVASLPSCDVIAVNCSYTGVSDILNELLRLHPQHIALGWRIDEDGWVQCSLRSRPDTDCSILAKQYGGGGHAQAAGFRIAVANHAAAYIVRR